MEIEIPNYQLQEELFQSDRSIIYKAIDERDQSLVIIKVLNSEYPSIVSLARFQYEFGLMKKLRGAEDSQMIQVREQVKLGNTLALIMEDMGGVSLDQLIQGKVSNTSLDLDLFLSIAIEMIKAVGWLHQQRVIHKDINPSNIVWNSEKQDIKIIDFGISTELEREYQDTNIANQLEGSLAYISPEQTGRMNRDLDYRTDYYSLGVTFFELLTGSLPFHAEDTIGWVHCHIAQTPPSPQEINPSIPTPLSDIILKLMAKNPEDRYQSTHGLLLDLNECQKQWKSNQTILDFPLAAQDVSARFQIHQKLLGREKELEILMKAFSRVSKGTSEYLLIAGYSGVGKSSLINEIHRPIVEKNGIFIEGKFDQFKKDVPYSALSYAFEKLTRQFLSLPPDKLESWKVKLLEALGPNGQIILDVVPSMEKVLGKQPPVQELNPTEEKNRFLITFRNLVKVLAQPNHPLVLFVDDLQWVDIPTLGLLEHLITTREIQNFLFIGAYRDNEVGEGHPLYSYLEAIEKSKELSKVVLQPLTELYVNQIVAETTIRTSKDSAPLAALIYQKTNGNPFFVNESLKNLYREEQINFLADNGHWDWDLEAISKMGITDNVVDLMITRLEKLPKDTQEILCLASCVGNEFALETLRIVAERSFAATGKILLSAIQEGVIYPLNARHRLIEFQEEGDQEFDFEIRYRFQHDRVQQAAYSVIDEEKKKEIHLSIARLMLQNTPEANLVDQIITITTHFNQGKELIHDVEEKDQLSRLNLQAGKKAMASNAPSVALEYFQTAKEFLPTNAWETNHVFSFEVYREFMEAAYSVEGQLKIAEEVSILLLERAQTNLEKANVYRRKMLHHSSLSQFEESVETAIQGLDYLGVKFALRPSKISVMKEFFQVKWNLRNKKITELIDLPLLQSPEKRMILKLLLDMIDPTYQLGLNNNWMLCILKSINVALRHGNSPESAFGYGMYGVILSVMGNFKGSADAGNLSVKLNDQLKDMEYRCRVHYIYNIGIVSWNQHWQRTFPGYKEALDAGYQSGDLLFVSYILAIILVWDPTQSLDEKLTLAQTYQKMLEETEVPTSIDWGNIHLHQYLNLAGKTPDFLSLSSAEFDEQECLQRMTQLKFFTGIAVYHITKAIICFTYDSYPQALEAIQQAEQHTQALLGNPYLILYHFYSCVIYAALYPTMERKDQKRAWKQMKKDTKQVSKWNNHFSENTAHLVAIMQAELAHIQGKEKEAIQAYKQSITLADKNNFLHNKALANKLLGKYYITLGEEELASIYLSKACYDYQIWGAVRVVEFLEEKYTSYLSALHESYLPDRDASRTKSSKRTRTQSRSGTSSTTGQRSGSSENIDLDTLLKASRTLSGEIELEQLLEKLIVLVLENAGAENAILMLNSKEGSSGPDNLLIQGISLKDQPARLLQAQHWETSGLLPPSIVQYVIRSNETLVLDDAANQGEYTRDPYIREKHPCSLLCLPIINQGRLGGLLYLENNLATGAFTPDRVEVLETLASQAAISIENAQLYSNLEDKVEQRTEQLNQSLQQLEQQHQELKQTQTQLIQSEKMASLGTLVAGVAHELNNPAAASQRGAEQLQNTLFQLEHALFKLSELNFSEEQLSALEKLKQLTHEQAKQPTDLDPLTRSDRESEIEQYMEGQGIQDAWELAPMLINMGYDSQQLSGMAKNFTTEQFPTVLASLCHIYTTHSLLEELGQGSGRISEIVKALKSYAYLDQAPIQSIDVHEGLNNTLVILHSKLKKGVAVKRDYAGDLPPIQAFGSELNQVWTNIIDNAIGAMKGQGEIVLKTYRDDSWVIVEIKDTGPGIPESIQSKIFDPFFTTKAPGEGTGLGLNISHNIIVQKHHGEITVSSKPGETCFKVKLPLYLQERLPQEGLPQERLSEESHAEK